MLTKQEQEIELITRKYNESHKMKRTLYRRRDASIIVSNNVHM